MRSTSPNQVMRPARAVALVDEVGRHAGRRGGRRSSDSRSVASSAGGAARRRSPGEDGDEAPAVAHELAVDELEGERAAAGVGARPRRARARPPSPRLRALRPVVGKERRRPAGRSGPPRGSRRALGGAVREEQRAGGVGDRGSRRGADSASARKRSSLSDSAFCAWRRSRRICASRSSRSRIGHEAQQARARDAVLRARLHRADRGRPRRAFPRRRRKGTSMSRSFRATSASKAPSSPARRRPRARRPTAPSCERVLEAPRASSTRRISGSKPPRRSSSERSALLDAASSTTQSPDRNAHFSSGVIIAGSALYVSCPFPPSRSAEGQVRRFRGARP